MLLKTKRMQKKMICAGVFAALFLLLIIMVKTVDVAAIGPNGTKIGFSALNGAIHDLFGVNLFWYSLTEIFGYLALLIAFLFVVIGVLQWFYRKALVKVDREIFALGGLYVVVLALYALFEKLIVNYRPILMEGSAEAEASFPSSHTMLICVIMASTMMVLNRYVTNPKTCRIMKTVCGVILCLTVIGRLVCGVHWFTDIVAGILISAAILFLFSAMLDVLERRR